MEIALTCYHLPLIWTVRLLVVTYESVLSNYSARYYTLLEGTQKE